MLACAGCNGPAAKQLTCSSCHAVLPQTKFSESQKRKRNREPGSMRCIECIANEEQAGRATAAAAHTPADAPPVSEYEQQRNANMAENEKFARGIGLDITSYSLAPSATAATSEPARADDRASAGGGRRLAFLPANDSSLLRLIELAGPLRPGINHIGGEDLLLGTDNPDATIAFLAGCLPWQDGAARAPDWPGMRQGETDMGVPAPLLTHLPADYMAYSEWFLTHSNPLAERICFSQVCASRCRWARVMSMP